MELIKSAIESQNVKLLEHAIKEGACINQPDFDGNTAVHIAISTDASIEILHILFENGGNIHAPRNNDEKYPLQCLQSLQCTLNLLELKTYFDFIDASNNTLIHHILGEIGDNMFGLNDPIIEGKTNEDGQLDFTINDAMIDRFWVCVVEKSDKIQLDMNSQNNIGSSPLHMAAKSMASIKHLETILSCPIFESANLLNTDIKGETFLHVYFAEYKLREYSDFDSKLLHGQFTNCPKDILKKLLLSQNNKNETPIHLYFKNLDNEINRHVLQYFLDAGADFSKINTFGETVLHCAFRDLRENKFASKLPDSKEADTIRYLVQNGANINVQNEFGQSALFYASREESVRVLLDLGADIHLRNKSGQTPLLSCLFNPEPNLDIITMLAEYGSDVNAVDDNENGLLHYAAWYGFSTRIIRAIKSYGTNSRPDLTGKLPCQVVSKHGNREVLRALCQCDSNSHIIASDILHLSQEVINYKDLFHGDKLSNLSERFRFIHGQGINELLGIASIGHVTFEDESEMIRSALQRFLSDMCNAIASKEAVFRGHIMQSGSVGENTKVGVPDEFDFVYILEEFSEKCVIDKPKSAEDPDFVYLRIKDEHTSTFDNFTDIHGYLNCPTIFDKFLEFANEFLNNHEVYRHPNIWPSDDMFKDIGSPNSPTYMFAIRWVGGRYKQITINVDVVPVIQLKSWWPNNASLDAIGDITRQNDEILCLALVQTEQQTSKFRISAFNAEKSNIKSLPNIAKNAYIISKILLDNRLCPKIETFCEIDVNDFVTSYMLKNCMFYISQKHKFSQPNDDTTPCPDESCDLSKFVIEIFEMLLQFSVVEKLPSYLFPWQNVFTFKLNRDIGKVENSFNCCYIRVFAKIMLTMLGCSQDFNDIDLTVLLNEEAFRISHWNDNRDHSDSESE